MGATVGLKKKRKKTGGGAAMREEVWTELVPNEDAGFTYLASTRGNKCFGISTLPLLPPLHPPSGVFEVSACLIFLVSYGREISMLGLLLSGGKSLRVSC